MALTVILLIADNTMATPGKPAAKAVAYTVDASKSVLH